MSQTRPTVERVLPPKAPFVVANAVVRVLLRSPLHSLVSKQLMLLEFRGRRSGRRISIPVGRQDVRGRLAAITNSPWRVNFRGGAPCELTLEGRRVPARAELVEDPDEVAGIYEELIARIGLARAGRRLGIRINVERAPTHDELAEAARRLGLSVVFFALGTAAAS